MVSAHVFITGKVQGAYFRYRTRDEAKKHGVTGWVRNIPDGRVEAVFNGNKENVNKLIDFAGKWPSGARVLNVDVNWQDYNEEFGDFEVEENLNPSKPMVLGLLKIVDFQCAKHEMFESHKNIVFASFDWDFRKYYVFSNLWKSLISNAQTLRV
ncbi:acylphosphatase [Methanobacterium sp.]|jgi:acylphosphatase|uniref:acylphosphatase n=1 Tax=Methanobacterium sp. TaxID=2164 RepID=UPI00315906DA